MVNGLVMEKTSHEGQIFDSFSAAVKKKMLRLQLQKPQP